MHVGNIAHIRIDRSEPESGRKVRRSQPLQARNTRRYRVGNGSCRYSIGERQGLQIGEAGAQDFFSETV